MTFAARLATFMPDDDRSGSAREARARDLKDAFDEGFEAGARAGAEAAANDFAELQAQLSARLLEDIEDRRAERTEVQAQVIGQFAALMRTLADRLVPAMAAAGLPGMVEEALRSALDSRPQAMPELRCAAEILPALQHLAEAHPDAFHVTADPTLTPMEARLHWDDGVDRIAMDQAVTLVLDTLAGLEDATLQEESRDVG